MSLSHTPERDEVISFSYPYLISPVTFLAPLPLPKHFDNLFEPFDTYIWLSILASLLCLTIIFIIMHKSKSNYMSGLIWSLYLVIFGQTIPDKYLKPNRVKLIFSLWLLACFVLSKCYSSSVYELILVNHENKLKTIDDLIKASNANNIKMYARYSTMYSQLLVNYVLYNISL